MGHEAAGKSCIPVRWCPLICRWACGSPQGLHWRWLGEEPAADKKEAWFSENISTNSNLQFICYKCAQERICVVLDAPIQVQRTADFDCRLKGQMICESGRTRPHEGDNHQAVKLKLLSHIMRTDIFSERLSTDSGPHDWTPVSSSPPRKTWKHTGVTSPKISPLKLQGQQGSVSVHDRTGELP